MLTRAFSGSVAELHALAMPSAAAPTHNDGPELWHMHPTERAIAMGSSQKPEDFDVTGARIALAPRRSGGGAVFIEPTQTVWADLVAPRSSPWWSSELSENFLLVGRVWQDALAGLGVETTLCVDAPVKSDASRHACWAGAGWGELLIGESKVVGLSQRRTRWGVRVQAMAVLDSSSARVAAFLPATVRDEVAAAIATDHGPVLAAAGVTAEVLSAAVADAFLTHS